MIKCKAGASVPFQGEKKYFNAMSFGTALHFRPDWLGNGFLSFFACFFLCF
ncbi:hypothetical protein NC99_15820 [Sunxiuqinia dokdonensis]|uniref:Uncharacterized protein n=1 Tax=Sunxiuqinia dokdonensis TaxID=1409788 RepID=A0A0L8VBP4_9BACT|nr:hypothetical protein NC99_15820 [Sunxiuqinia dokdonensis]